MAFTLQKVERLFGRKTMKLGQYIHYIMNYKKTSTWGKRNSKTFVSYLRANGIKVGENVKFRFPKSTTIDISRPSLVEIGSNLDINANFTIMTHDFGTYVFRNAFHNYVSSSGRVKIGSNIYFGRDVTILKGVTIGDNCIIGIGSVVTHDIPSNSVAVGNPCRVICSLEDYYQKRIEKQVIEALDLGCSIIENMKREPKITDFKEEWVLFLTEDDITNHPEIMPEVNSRVGLIKDDFFLNRKLFFNGFDEFLQAIYQRYTLKRLQNNH